MWDHNEKEKKKELPVIQGLQMAELEIYKREIMQLCRIVDNMESMKLKTIRFLFFFFFFIFLANFKIN